VGPEDGGNPWRVLGLAPTQDLSAIRRAYAVRLKAIDAASDPEAFRRLRGAYEWALSWAKFQMLPDQQVDSQAAVNEVERTTPPDDADAPEDPYERYATGCDAALAVATRDLRHLRDTLDSEGEEAALAVFENLWRAYAALPLAVLSQLEAAVAEALVGRPQFPMTLVDALAQRFEWDQVSIPANDGPAVARLLSERDQVRHYRKRINEARGWREHFGEKLPFLSHIIALNTLTGPCRPLWFHVLSLGGPPQHIGPLLEELGEAPDSVQALFDPQSLAWWKSYLARRQPAGGRRPISPARVQALALTACILTIGILVVSHYSREPPSPNEPKPALLAMSQHWARIGGDGPYLYFILGAYVQLLSEVRYGIDTPIPDRRADFPHLTAVKLPSNVRYVSMQLVFTDGTQSPIVRFNRP